MGVNESLCQSNQPNRWCTYEAVDNFTIKIQILYLAALALLACAIGKQFYQLIRYRYSEQYRHLFGKVFIQIYLLVLAWLCGSIFRTILNIVMYFKYMEQSFQQPIGSKGIDHPLVISASIYTFLDFICSFLVNFMMIIIPCQWLRIILLNISEHKLKNIQLRKTIKKYFIVLSFVRFYYRYIRLIYLTLLIVEPFLLFFTNFGGCSWPKFNYIWVISQSSLILLFYIFCAATASYLRNNDLLPMRNSDFNRIKIEYTLLLIVVIFRISLNFIFRVSNLYEYEPTDNCSDPVYENKILASIYLSLHHFFMHLLAISVIIYIYRPTIEQKQIRLIQVDEQSNIPSLKTESSQNYEKMKKQFFQSSFFSSAIRKNSIEDDENKSNQD